MGDLLCLKIRGNLVGKANELRFKLNELLDEFGNDRNQKIIMDVKKITRIDSASLYILTDYITESIRSRDGKVVFVGLGRGLMNTIVLAHMGKMATPIYEKAKEAIERIKNAA
jgi:anti-anti-sigma regulatory factor